jgi:UMF1 family MFS transporter
VLLLVFSNFCFGSGENLIAAFLPELAQGESLGRVSGWGWSLGHLATITRSLPGICQWGWLMRRTATVCADTMLHRATPPPASLPLPGAQGRARPRRRRRKSGAGAFARLAQTAPASRTLSGPRAVSGMLSSSAGIRRSSRSPRFTGTGARFRRRIRLS